MSQACQRVRESKRVELPRVSMASNSSVVHVRAIDDMAQDISCGIHGMASIRANVAAGSVMLPDYPAVGELLVAMAGFCLQAALHIQGANFCATDSRKCGASAGMLKTLHHAKAMGDVHCGRVSHCCRVLVCIASHCTALHQVHGSAERSAISCI